MKEWTNWLKQECDISEIEESLFLNNPEYKDWKIRFFKYSNGKDSITYKQVMSLDENWWKQHIFGHLFDCSSKYVITLQSTKYS